MENGASQSGALEGQRLTGNLQNRHYLSQNVSAERRNLHQAALSADYRLDQLMARGAESVLYTGSCGGREVCIKAVRNTLNKWIGDSKTRSQEEKLEKVPYHTKIRHISNEYEVSKVLYEDGDIPLVHIYSLRKVTRLGFELGYDLIMELFRGHDLADKILAKSLGLEDKLDVFVQAVQALEYMHRRHLIHLDIKPSNFMLNNGKVKLIDFGVSVKSGFHPRAVTGTGGYLSPEQMCKETLDEGTDIFALGIAFGVFFGGKNLHQPQESLLLKQTRMEAKYHLEQDAIPVLSEVPDLKEIPRFAEIIRNCTIPRRDRRTSSCQAILAQVRAWSADSGVRLPSL